MNNILLKDGRRIYSSQGFQGSVIREDEEIPVYGSLYLSSSSSLYLCHNNDKLKGSESPDLLGYNYSWIFGINNDGSFSQGVKVHKLYDIIEFDIELSLFLFFDLLKINSIKHYLINTTSRYNKFNYLKSSNKKGFINISNKEKSIDIKIGRFIKSIIDDSKRFPSLFKTNSPSFIEDINNKFISFQNSNFVEVKILKGKDILKGYTSENYHSTKNGNLCTSCMNNKSHFLSLYTENSNISLAVLYLNEKIVTRCLVWNINGQLYYDKMYINYEWCKDSIISYFNKNNILPIGNKELIVELDKSDFTYYPYLDTFYYIDLDNNLLSNKIKYKNLIQSTSGQILIS